LSAHDGFSRLGAGPVRWCLWHARLAFSTLEREQESYGSDNHDENDAYHQRILHRIILITRPEFLHGAPSTGEGNNSVLASQTRKDMRVSGGSAGLNSTSRSPVLTLFRALCFRPKARGIRKGPRPNIGIGPNTTKKATLNSCWNGSIADPRLAPKERARTWGTRLCPSSQHSPSGTFPLLD
jgi:hypothetical protein